MGHRCTSSSPSGSPAAVAWLRCTRAPLDVRAQQLDALLAGMPKAVPNQDRLTELVLTGLRDAGLVPPAGPLQ